MPMVPSPVASPRVLRVALGSRVCISLLALLTALLVKPYDTSTRLLLGSPTSSPSLLASLASWDAVFFTSIATRGYEYEHEFAFFPLYALLVRWTSALLRPVVDESLAVLLAGYLLSNACFVGAAVFLYRLGCLVLRHEPTARRAAYLFCITPSSIFMTAIYSESLMCLLSFAGLYAVERYRHDHRYVSLLIGAACFGAASATRSNGALLSLFIAWYRLVESPSPLRSPLRFLKHWLATAVLGVIAIGPQLAYFVYGIRLFCPRLVDALFATTSAPTLLTHDRPWCGSVRRNVSAMYMFIQREYWNVGFLRYYEWKQLPNFTLASPMLMLTAYSLCRFFYFLASRPSPAKQRSSLFLTGSAATPYFVHWAFLFVNALLVVHIQVTTRLLAACPPLFWAPAAFFFSDTSPRPLAATFLVAYFLVFYVLGAGLFSSFYPWT